EDRSARRGRRGVVACCHREPLLDDPGSASHCPRRPSRGKILGGAQPCYDPDQRGSVTHAPDRADSAIASSASALRTASSSVVPCGVPSAIERRKLYASITFR